MQFGYLEKKKPDEDFGKGLQLDSPVVVKALSDFQWFGGLPVTGKLDRETVKLLNVRRCGMKDPKLNSTNNNTGSLTAGRYYLQGTYWKKKVLKH